MSDSPDYDPVLLAWVTPIVTALADVVPAEQLMLVGAQCRDLLHWCFCRGVPPRATNDTDIAGTLNNWDHFEAIRATFRALGSTGHRFLIADRAVDALPFGEVESPTGTTRHPPGNQLMNVHGCTDAYLRADVLPLPGGLTVHLPQPPNYAVLKLHAWLDRSADHDYKDGPDLALVVHWYAGDLDRLYAKPDQWASALILLTGTELFGTALSWVKLSPIWHVFSFAVDTRPIATLLDYASHPIDPRSYSSVAVTAVGAEATLLAFFFATVGVVASTALNTLRSSPPLLLSSPRLTTGCDR